MNLLRKLTTPILLQGNKTTAYRDPTAIYYQGTLYLYFTMVKTEPDGKVYLYTAVSKSRNLRSFTEPVILTQRDQSLNFSSPGNIIRHDNQWIMCLQTYPRQNGEKYGNNGARLWTMSSFDLDHWSEPELLRVKGSQTPDNKMGRMIDPYLIEDNNEPGKYWCFYKQNGVSMSYSYDLKNWHYSGSSNAGENVCVIKEGKRYLMFHSPHNGIGILESTDLVHWSDTGKLITLGQNSWPWAQGRITAGFVLNCRNVPDIGKYLMFLHGTGPENEEVIFDTHACIGIAWSDNLFDWEYPE